MSRRKPTPAQVIFFAKKAPRTQTVPEVPTVIIDEVMTDVGPEPKQPRKRTRTSGSMAAVTVTDMPAVNAQAEAAADPNDSTSELVALGHALFEKGKVREAKIVFEGLALSLPKDAFVRTMLGTVCLALNDLAKALEHFEAALVLDPHDMAARVYRGELRLHRRKFRPAIDDLEYAVLHGQANDPFVDRARRLLKMAKRAARR